MTDTNLATALAKVQAQLAPVGKDKKANAGQFSYTYADLASVQAAVFPLLAAEGLAWTACPTLGEHGFVLYYALSHGPSDEKVEGLYPLPDPSRGTPQQIGSAITYARRYCLSAVVGVATEDDDGKAASADTAPRATRRPNSPAAKHDRELRGPSSSGVAEHGPVPPDEDPFVAPEWAAPFRTRLAKAMTPEALRDRWLEVSEAVKNGEISPEWGQTLHGEVTARKAHLEAEEAKPVPT
jgi:hypothetical protein